MRIPRWLIIPLIVVFLISITKQFWGEQPEEVATIYDIPKKLDNELLTIKVFPQAKSDSVFVFTTYKGGNEDDFLYLIPENSIIETPSQIMSLPDSVLNNGFNVTGHFFMGTGIPEAYIMNVPKVKRLRVFLYKSIDGLNKASVPDRVNTDSSSLP